MNKYSILIKGTGPCGDGESNSADMRLLELVKTLEANGHKLSSVSLKTPTGILPIVGPVEDHPEKAAQAADIITLEKVAEMIRGLEIKLSRFESYERRSDKAKDENEPGKKRGRKNEGGGAAAAKVPELPDEANTQTLPPEGAQAPETPEQPEGAVGEAAATETPEGAQAPELPDEANPQTPPPEGGAEA